MSDKCNCGCLFSWLSGFFAMPAIVHLVRALAGWEVTWQGHAIAIKTSWIIFGITAVLCVIFGAISCKKHKEGSPASCC
ncbi:MAG: hypothetical protein HYU98_06705 [Deltaproteobacteria bacterium]|nr:hypothetical protein [Deltaproteobacteria bacterium]